ncbi:MAG: hypothetical protein GY796_07800 [Chloroflexi bacterium]|nr:hypothetical protein [Chloroflexota bacterium]
MTRKQQLIPITLMMGLVVLVMALLTAVPASAQEAATLTADNTAVTVGDAIILTASVTHPENSVALFPELESNWGDFVVRSQSAPETVNHNDGSVTTSQQIDARLFAPGEFQTPPLPITISDSGGNLSDVLAAPLPLTVQTVLIEGDSNLRDIKPQANLPLPAIWPYLLVGFLIISGVVTFVIWKKRGGKLFVDNRLPHEKALDTLTDIDKQNFPANGRFKEQYAAVSNTLRTYFETNASVPMTDRTTAEIRCNLAASQMKEANSQHLLHILADADLVKFAKVQPSQHEAERLTQAARQLVLDTVEIGDQRLEIKDHPQSPIPNLQSPKEATI